jgi:YYY domain-containing protein
MLGLLRRLLSQYRSVPSQPAFLLLLVLAVALTLRLYGIDWDSGYGFHPDERSIYIRAGCMYDVLTGAPGYQDCVRDFPGTEPGIPGLSTFLDANRSPLNPHWFPLGSILIYALVFFQSVIELFIDIDPLDLRYVGRLLSALADVGTVFLVYLLGRRLFGQKVGLLAAGLTALSVIHIQNSHFYRPETFSVFFILASFWAMLRLVEHRRLRDSVLLGVMVGLAVAPKVSVLPLVLPLALAYGYWALNAAGGRWLGLTPEILSRMLTHAGAAGVTAVAVFILLTPYALLDFTTFVADLVAQTTMARQAGLWPFTIQYIDTPAYIYQIQQTILWGLGLPLGLVAWASIPFSAAMALRCPETRRANLLLLAWVVPQLVFLESFEVHFLRYVFPLMPIMVLMGARMLLSLTAFLRNTAQERVRVSSWNSSPAQRASQKMMLHLPKLGLALVALIVATTAFYALAFEMVYAKEHPAVAASRWIRENVPPGTAIVSDNHWDEFIPELYRYDVWQFPAYEADSQAKMKVLAHRLAQAEYLVFYSYRPYVSITRAWERYPLSSSYYHQLFNGDLGYRLERTFTSFPELLGISFQDDPYSRAGLPQPEPLVREEPSSISLNLGYADDNVVGYDHPQVLLFRNVEQVAEPILLTRLLGGLSVGQPENQVGLLLSDEAKAAQRHGGTWSEIFHRDSWPNQAPILFWLLAVELVYLAALPLAMFIFRPLPDRGIVLARALGLLSVGYVTWLLVSLGWLNFSRSAILVGFSIVALLSALALLACWRDIRGFFVQHWRLFLLGEAMFLLAFLAFVGIRAANPDLWHPFRGGEKPMELAYLNAVVRSTTFPPYDPWFSGGYLNYYYWGYLVVTLPIRLTGIMPTTAFNLAVPCFFALTFTGAYSLVYNLAEGTRRSSNGKNPVSVSNPKQQRTRMHLQSPITVGLMAGFFVSVVGNLDGLVQLAQGLWRQMVNSSGSLSFDYWRSSRMIPPLENIDPSPLAFWVPDKVPGAPEVSYHITEFPFFTFLFADLHAHMMVIPFTLLVIGLGLNLVVGLRDRGGVWSLIATSALGLALGSLWVINSWDYPSYLVMVVALLGLAVFLRPGNLYRRISYLVLLVLGVVIFSVLAFLPFHQAYETFDAGIAASKWQTPIDRYLGIHGLFLFVVVTFLILQTRHTLVRFIRRLLSVSAGPGVRDKTCGRDVWQRVYLVVGILGMLYLAAAGYWTAMFLLSLLILTGLAAWNAFTSPHKDRAYAVVPLILLAMALMIGFGVDFVRLNGDIGRMNTLFKLYLEGWVLFSLASAYMLWVLASQGWFRSPWGWRRGAWVGGFALLFVSNLIYTGLGTQARLADRFTAGPVTLDGTAYLRDAVHVEQDQRLELKWDLEAIQWLQDNVEGSPVVLEAHNEQYHWSARISNYTGLPTVIGWPWHQTQQRTAYASSIRERAEEVRELYNTSDLNRAQDLLKKYEVQYIVVGELERAYYSPEGLDKFEKMAEQGLIRPVFQSKKVTIYVIFPQKMK